MYPTAAVGTHPLECKQHLSYRNPLLVFHSSNSCMIAPNILVILIVLCLVILV